VEQHAISEIHIVLNAIGANHFFDAPSPSS
jgi:hypothetical protein